MYVEIVRQRANRPRGRNNRQPRTGRRPRHRGTSELKVKTLLQPSSPVDESRQFPSCGAEWLRCDLHLHSGYDRKTFGEPITQERHAFQSASSLDLHNLAKKFIRACADAQNRQGLDLVAITDHNTIEGYRKLKPHFDEIREQNSGEFTKIPIILPGVEITVGGERPVHILVIFSSDTDVDEIDGAIKYIFGARDPFDSSTDQPRSTGQSINHFFDSLYDYAKPQSAERNLDFVVIPAHVMNTSGIGKETISSEPVAVWKDLRGHLRQKAITHKNWNGFQISRSFEQLPSDFKELLCHWIAVKEGLNWDVLSGDQKRKIRERKHWPLIQCSDPMTLAQIGSRCTWFKVGIKDLEGIRLALFDPESRIRLISDGLPSYNYPRIERIRIKETDLFDDIEIPFSPNLTTIIGGRGTGKSTIIEYLRYALDRAKMSDFPDLEQNRRTKTSVDSILSTKECRDFGRTLGTLLNDFKIELDVIVLDHRYRITRTKNGLEAYSTSNQDLKTVDVRALIAAKIISQRQIAEIAENPASLRNELDSLIDFSKLSELQEHSRKLNDEMVQLQATRRQLSDAQAQLPAIQTELHTIRNQIEFVEKSGNQIVLNQFHEATLKERHLNHLLDDLNRTALELEEMADSVEFSVGSDIFGREKFQNRVNQSNVDQWLERVVDQIQDTRHELVADLKKRADDLKSLSERLKQEKSQTWNGYFETVKELYRNLEVELNAKGINSAHHEQMLQRRAFLENKEKRLARITYQIEENDKAIHDVRTRLIEIHRGRFRIRQRHAQQLRDMDVDIRLQVREFGDREDFESRREQWLGGSGIREHDWTVMCDYVFQVSEKIPERIGMLVRAIREDTALTEQVGRQITASQSKVAELVGPNLEKHFFRFLQRQDRIRLNEIERFLPEDLVKGEARSVDHSFKAIETGSIGQRSTAILSLLLSAGNQPIVIDQPEDDLDNQYVYRVVVDLLRRKKFSRQVIVVTHNANIPVNGDSELIVTLGVDGQRGTVLCQGSIDQGDVKDQVSLIMEGSVEAFRRRRERYGY